MRALLVVFLLSGAAGLAGAHTLGAEQGLFDQLGHQFLSPHHLPLMLLVVLGCAIALRGRYRRRN